MLSSCPECGKQVSDRAAACPHCGFPLGTAGVPQALPAPQEEEDFVPTVLLPDARELADPPPANVRVRRVGPGSRGGEVFFKAALGALIPLTILFAVATSAGKEDPLRHGLRQAAPLAFVAGLIAAEVHRQVPRRGRGAALIIALCLALGAFRFQKWMLAPDTPRVLDLFEAVRLPIGNDVQRLALGLPVLTLALAADLFLLPFRILGGPPEPTFARMAQFSLLALITGALVSRAFLRVRS